MKFINVSEVGIDPQGRLYVVPVGQRLEFIYRAAMEVNWDESKLRLYAPNRSEWSYPRWLAQIEAAVTSEYGCRPKASVATVWTNIPDEMKAEMLGLV